MRKILYIVSTLKRSGPTNQLYNLIKYLDRSRFEPYLITLSPEPADSRWSDYEVLGVKLYSLSLSRVRGLFFAKSKLKSLINKLQPDLVHTQGIRGDALSASLKVNVPKIATIRNFPQHDYSMTYSKIQAKFMLWQHPRALRKLELCIGVSKAVTANLVEQFGIHHTAAIPNGVDTESYRKVTHDERVGLRQKLALSKSAEIWISSGHLSDRKDPFLIIAAWKAALGKDNLKQLVFIGDGPARDKCEAGCKDYPNIHFVGRVENVAEYLQASDYFVSASRAEGLPNAVLEALACGLPVLLSDIGPHREIWEMAPDIGLLFELGSKESLQVAINSFVQQDRVAQSKAALFLVNKRLSAQVMSENYQNVYMQHIDGVTR